MTGKVIVVDGSRTICMFAEYILKRANYEVLVANDFDACLALLDEHGSVDGILSGLNIEDGSPFSMFENLKLFAEAAPTVLMFSRKADVDFCDWIAHSKFAGCLQKPLNEEVLLKIMSRAVARRDPARCYRNTCFQTGRDKQRPGDGHG